RLCPQARSWWVPAARCAAHPRFGRSSSARSSRRAPARAFLSLRADRQASGRRPSLKSTLPPLWGKMSAKRTEGGCSLSRVQLDQFPHSNRRIGHAVGETPLVIVPAHHADKGAIDHLGLIEGEGRRCGVVI